MATAAKASSADKKRVTLSGLRKVKGNLERRMHNGFGGHFELKGQQAD